MEAKSRVVLQERGSTIKRLAAISGMSALCLIILSFVVKSALDHVSVPPWGNPLGGGLSPEIVGDTRVGQLFTAPLPGLYRIDIGLVRATSHGARDVTIHLRSAPTSPDDLRSAVLNTQAVEDGGPYGFEFEPIRDSKGQTFYFYLESAGSAPGDAMAARYDPETSLEGASAYLNGKPVSGNLQFNTFYSLRTRDRVDLLLTRMAEGRPYMLGSKGFYVGLAGAYVSVLGTFLWLVAKAVLQSPEERR